MSPNGPAGTELLSIDGERPAVLPGSLEERVIEAAMRCVARWGTSKTGLADVAQEAGVSRATIYRAFPGGKDTLLLAAVGLELNRFFDRLGERLALASTLEELITTGLVAAGRALIDHPALLPLVARFVCTDATDSTEETRSVLLLVTECATPHLARFLDPRRARGVAELLARLAITFAVLPSEEVDITDEQSVRTFLYDGMILPSPGYAR